MNYTEAISWLTSAASFGIKPGLERIQAILEKLDNPQNAFRSIHIAGTNGKGTVAAMIESVLLQAEIKTGCFTSPHLTDYTERIAVDGEPISREDFAHYLTEIRTIVEELEGEGKEPPTAFEILTAAAFLCFREKECEYAVVEVGLGGLLDSTNVITPELSIITNVSLDHTEYCGETVEDIARHKAGIIKPGVPVATAARSDALNIIKEVAKENNSKLHFWGQDYSVETRSTGKLGQILTIKRKNLPDGLFFVPFFGKHQVVNSAVTVMALTVLMEKESRITEDHLREGIARAKWPGRFEVFKGDVPIIFDGAHNQSGAEALALTLEEQYPGAKRIFVFSSLKDKDLGAIVGELFSADDTVIVVPAPTERSREPEEVAGMLPCNAMTAESVQEGLAKAIDMAREGDIVCVCGSLYILGEARNHIRNQSLH